MVSLNSNKTNNSGWEEKILKSTSYMTAGLLDYLNLNMKIISLASKMYYCDAKKFSSKGINKKQNEITKQKYLDALNGNSAQEFVNNGFRVNNNQMNTYCLTKTGMKLLRKDQSRV